MEKREVVAEGMGTEFCTSLRLMRAEDVEREFTLFSATLENSVTFETIEPLRSQLPHL